MGLATLQLGRGALHLQLLIVKYNEKRDFKEEARIGYALVEDAQVKLRRKECAWNTDQS